MPKLTLNLDTLQVQSFAPSAKPVEALAAGFATANTCYRSCGVTRCLC